jgi:hypothetical protein
MTIEAPLDFVSWDVAAAVACRVQPADVTPNKFSPSFVTSFLRTLNFYDGKMICSALTLTGEVFHFLVSDF